MFKFIYRFYKRFQIRSDLEMLREQKEYNQKQLRYWQYKLLMRLNKDDLPIYICEELIKMYEEKLLANNIDIEAKEQELLNL